MIKENEKWKKLLTNNMTYKGPSKFRDPNPLIRANEQKENQDFKAQFLELKKKHEQLEAKVNKTKEDTGQGTARQICLAFHYMRKEDLTPRKSGIPLVDAEFMSFLSGLSKDNLRKLINNPFKIDGEDKDGKKVKSLLNDLNKVKFHFGKIQFTKGLQLIEKDINTYENTVESYKQDK
jgi:hypothetical protein